MKRTGSWPRSKPLARTEFRRGVSGLGKVSTPRSIKPRTPQRAADERAYSRLRAAFLLANPECLVCGQPTTDCHHAAGRKGWRLLDVASFRAVCRRCHQEIHDSPRWAEAHGLSQSRLATRETP